MAGITDTFGVLKLPQGAGVRTPGAIQVGEGRGGVAGQAHLRVILGARVAVALAELTLVKVAQVVAIGALRVALLVEQDRAARPHVTAQAKVRVVTRTCLTRSIAWERDGQAICDPVDGIPIIGHGCDFPRVQRHLAVSVQPAIVNGYAEPLPRLKRTVLEEFIHLDLTLPIKGAIRFLHEISRARDYRAIRGELIVDVVEIQYQVAIFGDDRLCFQVDSDSRQSHLPGV
jgi:hypothetical protein